MILYYKLLVSDVCFYCKRCGIFFRLGYKRYYTNGSREYLCSADISSNHNI
jgi:hypothetical protein